MTYISRNQAWHNTRLPNAFLKNISGAIKNNTTILNMKIKVILASAALLLGGSVFLQAQDAVTNSTSHWYDWNDSTSSELYRNHELSLDAFGFGTVDEHTLNHLTGHRLHRDAQIGLGAGLDFFFNRYVGIEGEGYSESTHHNFVDDAGGNLILRYPIGNSGFAPYIFGGGGYQNDPVHANYADGGAGVEYRFIHWFGVFADGRYVLTDQTGNYAMGRLGVRFTF
jgi:hypothetical protein